MITDGTVDPDTTTVDYLETYTVVCDTGHTVSAAGPMNCQADGTLDTTLTCDSKLIKKCQKNMFTDIYMYAYMDTWIHIYFYFSVSTHGFTVHGHREYCSFF